MRYWGCNQHLPPNVYMSEKDLFKCVGEAVSLSIDFYSERLSSELSVLIVLNREVRSCIIQEVMVPSAGVHLAVAMPLVLVISIRRWLPAIAKCRRVHRLGRSWDYWLSL